MEIYTAEFAETAEVSEPSPFFSVPFVTLCLCGIFSCGFIFTKYLTFFQPYSKFNYIYRNKPLMSTDKKTEKITTKARKDESTKKEIHLCISVARLHLCKSVANISVLNPWL